MYLYATNLHFDILNLQNKMSADCEEPICIKTDPFGTYKKYLDKGKAQVFFTENENTSGNSSSSKESQSQSGQSDNSNNKKSEPEEETQEAKKPKSLEIDDYHACPNTRESLGFFTWNFLHTMAVYYPPTPTDDQKNKMRNFITGFAEFYPCKVCAHHFRNDIKKSINYLIFLKVF